MKLKTLEIVFENGESVACPIDHCKIALWDVSNADYYINGEEDYREVIHSGSILIEDKDLLYSVCRTTYNWDENIAGRLKQNDITQILLKNIRGKAEIKYIVDYEEDDREELLPFCANKNKYQSVTQSGNQILIEWKQ